VLDLLGPELADEPPQQLAPAVARLALDLDRRQHVAVALGDGEVKAELAGHELLELVADGADQRSVGAKVHGNVRGAPAPAEGVEAGLARTALAAAAAAKVRRRAQTAVVRVRRIRLSKHPSLQRHDQLR